MKHCPSCDTEKDESEFYRNKRKKDGRQTHCKQCHGRMTQESYRRKHEHYLKAKRRRNQEHRQRNREFLQQVKAQPCVDCRQTWPYYVMDFDHVRGKKSFTIGASFSKPLEELKREVAKCDVVCANCHRIRTHGRHDNMRP